VGSRNARAEARAYLRSNGKGNSNGKNNGKSQYSDLSTALRSDRDDSVLDAAWESNRKNNSNSRFPSGMEN